MYVSNVLRQQPFSAAKLKKEREKKKRYKNILAKRSRGIETLLPTSLNMQTLSFIKEAVAGGY